MNYKFETVYLGTLMEKNKDGDIYKGNIMCYIPDYGYADNLLNDKFYQYLDSNCHHSILNGQTYVSSVDESFFARCRKNIFRKKTLIKVALEFNKKGANIEIPTEQLVKVKRRK